MWIVYIFLSVNLNLLGTSFASDDLNDFDESQYVR